MQEVPHKVILPISQYVLINDLRDQARSTSPEISNEMDKLFLEAVEAGVNPNDDPEIGEYMQTHHRKFMEENWEYISLLMAAEALVSLVQEGGFVLRRQDDGKIVMVEEKGHSVESNPILH